MAAALAAATGRGWWVGRPVELPGSRPLRFDGTLAIGSQLVSWPAEQVVKCLVHYHPEDEPDLRARQERQLLRLFDACRKTRHELLIEVILPANMNSAVTTVAAAIRRLYAIGLRPDWWKLEPDADPEAWRHIEAAVTEGDPFCRGVVLLGLSAPESELVSSFEAAAPFNIVKGFAVGRTIFHEAARDWFADRISDEEAVAALAGKLSGLVAAWRKARGTVERSA